MPYRFEVGDQWIGLVDQTDEVVRMVKDGYLFLILYTAGGGRGHKIRVKVREKRSEES